MAFRRTTAPGRPSGYFYAWALDGKTAPPAVTCDLDVLDVAGQIDVAPFDVDGPDDAPVIVLEKVLHPELEN